MYKRQDLQSSVSALGKVVIAKAPASYVAQAQALIAKYNADLVSQKLNCQRLYTWANTTLFISFALPFFSSSQAAAAAAYGA